MKKTLVLLMVVALSLTMFIGCSNNDENNNGNANANANANANTNENANTDADNTDGEVDVVTTASIVTESDAFAKAMSADGTWIVASLNDIVLDEALVVEGEFTNKEELARKIGIYTQDENRVVLERYNLTVPSMTVKSENLTIKGGAVIGDIYVEANGFNIKDLLKVEGSIYFSSQEYRDSFVMDEANTEVTGSIEVADAVDVITTASIVTDADAFVNAMSAEGTWIVASLNDIVLDEALVIEGEFTNREEIARKIGLYTQDENRVVLERYNLTVPSMTVKSENLAIKGGTVTGDIYVEANGFNIKDLLKVEGNIYFSSQEYMDSFVMDKENSEVTGSIEVQ